MNIEFKIIAHGYEKAGQVVKVLKDLSIPYEERVAPSTAARKSHTKTQVTKVVAATILAAIDKHPGRSDAELSRECGVSAATIGRFRNGTHKLSKIMKPQLKGVSS